MELFVKKDLLCVVVFLEVTLELDLDLKDFVLRNSVSGLSVVIKCRCIFVKLENLS